MSKVYMIAQLHNMREKFYKSPKEWPMTEKQRLQFKYTSLKRSAISEIITHFMEIPWEDFDPIDEIERFRYKMDEKACNATTSELNFMYSVYYDVATDVLDTLIVMKEKK